MIDDFKSSQQVYYYTFLFYLWAEFFEVKNVHICHIYSNLRKKKKKFHNGSYNDLKSLSIIVVIDTFTACRQIGETHTEISLKCIIEKYCKYKIEV